MSDVSANNPAVAGIAVGHLGGEVASAPGASEVYAALEKVKVSPGFIATERSRHLLQYLVTEALADRKDRIKAYSIATEVLGRPSSFDPQKDPIVRIEAAKLRRELEHYYLTDGRSDRVVIGIPKGSYVPDFSVRDLPEDPAGAAAVPDKPAARTGPMSILLGLIGLLVLSGVLWYAWAGRPEQAHSTAEVHMPRLVVKPLSDLTRTRESMLLAQGLTERIIEKSSRFKELVVIAAPAAGESPLPTDARYELSGTLRLEENGLIVQVRMADRTDGRVIWAESYEAERKSQQLFGIESEIADQVVAKVAPPAGLVFEAERHALRQMPPDNWSAYLCTLSSYAYQAAYAASQSADVRSCLENAVAQYPDYATGWALLSLSYLDEVRFFYPPPPGQQAPAITRAHDAARRAVELDPTNLRAQQALMMALFLRGDPKASLDVGEAAFALNPNDTEFKGEFGFRLALAGEWERGCGMVRQAMDRSARRSPYYKIVLALCSYIKGDFETAAILIEEANASDNPVYHALSAAILAEAGMPERAARNSDWLRNNIPDQLPSLLEELPRRMVRMEDRARLTNSLRKAGLAPST